MTIFGIIDDFYSIYSFILFLFFFFFYLEKLIYINLILNFLYLFDINNVYYFEKK